MLLFSRFTDHKTLAAFHSIIMLNCSWKMKLKMISRVSVFWIIKLNFHIKCQRALIKKNMIKCREKHHRTQNLEYSFSKFKLEWVWTAQNLIARQSIGRHFWQEINCSTQNLSTAEQLTKKVTNGRHCGAVDTSF